ncbi:DUF6090 family protein [Ichthyenterobacterium sp. W332]|uniref:DUF6090 family protein n=1 Tax=Microcosmobacter mediterraneus TaxID=3075607 RepID=A0ABU2YJK1_9FLAO|nr:DUF6090 family protein [Ichthyenterobacterium sp. W332]MDT0558331.1 DUF6090 family protein [Ichthyenterobacterium sp. W332]
MIKFFRRVRQRLLTDNKFSKYLIYAIGEIILVVIGILLALSLNNWKEDLANQGEEERILSGLKQEFEINLAEIIRNIKLNTGTKESTIALILQIRSEDPFANSRYIDSLLNEVYMFGSFDAQTGLVNEVISSGKLSIIRDSELRDRLTAVSGLLDNLEEDYVIRSDYYMYHIIPYTSKYFSLVNQNNFMDFSSWSDTYETFKLNESPFKPKYEEIDLLLFENLIATHKLNNDFVNLDEYDLKKFYMQTLEIINANLESEK